MSTRRPPCFGSRYPQPERSGRIFPACSTGAALCGARVGCAGRSNTLIMLAPDAFERCPQLVPPTRQVRRQYRTMTSPIPRFLRLLRLRGSRSCPHAIAHCICRRRAPAMATTVTAAHRARPVPLSMVCPTRQCPPPSERRCSPPVEDVGTLPKAAPMPLPVDSGRSDGLRAWDQSAFEQRGSRGGSYSPQLHCPRRCCCLRTIMASYCRPAAPGVEERSRAADAR